MLTELVWMLIQMLHFLIHYISNILAKILTFFVIIYVIVSIRRLFKKERVVNPKGKAVLITGCDSGFGNQLALRLNSMGFRVYATVLNSSSEQNLIEKSNYKNRIVVWKMDVTIDEDVEDTHLKVIQDLQKNECVLWAVVNNAGYGILAQLEWVNMDEFKRIFEVNMFGMVRMTRKFLPLIKQAKGHVVNLSSQLGLITANGFGAYSMTKHAVTVFTDTLRREMHKFEVKVSGIYPGGYQNTGFIESQIKSCDRIWNQLEDSLKESYGNQQYFEKWRNWSIARLKSNANKNPELVVNDMIDAIVSSEPRISYSPNDNKYTNFMFNVFKYFPNYVKDWIDSY